MPAAFFMPEKGGGRREKEEKSLKRPVKKV